MKNTTIILIVIYIFVLATGIFWFGFSWGNLVGKISHDCPIPTRQELQEKLGVRPDEIIGQETLTAWKEYELKLFNEYALEAMKRMETAK